MKKPFVDIFLYIIITALIVEVVLLIKENRELKATVTLLTAGQAETLKPGERVEPIEIQTLDGKRSTLTYTDTNKKYLLFVFSTTCTHCERNLPMWKHIVDADRYHKANIIGVSTDNLKATEDYFIEKNIEFYIVSAEVDTNFHKHYRITGVPETILIDGDGKVEQSWAGELSEDQAHQIESLVMSDKSSLN